MWNRVSGIGRCNIIDNLIEKDKTSAPSGSIVEDLRSPNPALQVVSFGKYLSMHLLLLELQSIALTLVFPYSYSMYSC